MNQEKAYFLQVLDGVQKLLLRSIYNYDKKSFSIYLNILSDPSRRIDRSIVEKYLTRRGFESIIYLAIQDRGHEMYMDNDLFFIQKLVEAGSDPNQNSKGGMAGENGQTPLELSDELGYENISAYLRTFIPIKYVAGMYEGAAFR